MASDTKTHYLRHDLRVESLKYTISGLDRSINLLKNQRKEISWYDGIFFLEDSEPIYGLAFIAFQNYVNASIKDFSDSTRDKVQYYQLESSFGEFNRSSIELIIALANYSKHKDEDGDLHKATREILTDFGLNIDKGASVESSAIFEGLTILNEAWDLFQILDLVINWRSVLWDGSKSNIT